MLLHLYQKRLPAFCQISRTIRPACLCWRRPIFPGSRPPSIFGTIELNYRVRDGNGWTLNVIDTNYSCTFRLRFSALLSIATRWVLIFGDPYEIRTRVAGVRGRSLRPLDQRAVFLVHHQGLEPWTP